MSDFAFGILFILFVFCIMYYSMSKKETPKEKLGDMVSNMSMDAAEFVSGVARNLTEPSDKKKHRLAMEKLAYKNGCVYRADSQDDFKHYLKIDDDFRNALDVLGLTEDEWIQIAYKLYYVGLIKKESRYSSDYSKKNPKYMREAIFEKYPNSDYKWFRETYIELVSALKYFNIPKEDWIEYGDTVLDMYNVYNDKQLSEYGVITQLKPMSNNRHLL